MSETRPGCVGGLYEAMIGVPDLAPAIQYFERHGYRVGDIGELLAGDAKVLYGVDSGVRSVRLYHQEAGHGLVRLMHWDRPTGDGLGMNGFRVAGSRWGACMTRSIMNVMNHVEKGLAAGLPMKVVDPVFAVIYQQDLTPRAFQEEIVGVREMMLVQPLTRQVFFERFGYDNPSYGRINDHCLLRTSQITHFGLVICSDDHGVLDFYDQTLGLFRSSDHEVPYEQAVGSRPIFELEEGETHWLIDFDDPGNAERPWNRRRSGRLKIIRFPESSGLKDMRDASRAGALGYACYSWRVDDIEGMHSRVREGGATAVGDVTADEFGVRSFTLTAPDGVQWTLLEA